ncbi:YhgE/Pip domain-containing protein [Planotetraspora phitsanulokensis]|uniref:Membrane protein n=1 Tax=Planotetraspora phitsanulokensis TaxID=575192 RepID=A0A8J3U8P9_9ACTN|nr:YhgE/Pip domain-containing protein [Planotetraspora phitsanulokensis]GII40673.1 membrane protein [Planotetraspora phitsanulokensis]
MNLGRLELRRFMRSRLTRIALVGVVTLPLLYAGLYLWSFWDPQGNLKHLPVALVVEDQPATADGETIDAGRELAAELKERDVFAWHDVDATGAAQGVEDGTYYLSLTIPKDFSADLASPSGDGDPTPARLGVRVDTGRSYIVRSISDAVFEEVKQAAGQSAVHGYLDQIFLSFGDLHDQTAEAADGAGRLHDGTASARDGAATLRSGLGDAQDAAGGLSAGAATLHRGSRTLAGGLDDAAGGARDLTSGLATADKGAADLRKGVSALDKGSATLAKGNKQAYDQVHALSPTVNEAADTFAPVLTANGERVRGAALRLADDADRLADKADASESQELRDLAAEARAVADGARQVADAAPELGTRLDHARDEFNDLDHGLKRLSDGAASLHRGTGEALDGATSLAGGLGTLHDGARDLSAGLGRLDAGAGSLDAGLGTLASGADRLDGGIDQLYGGAGRLDTGLVKLTDGASDLATGLSDGAAKIPDYGTADRGSRTGMMSDPVRLDTEVDNGVPNYGTGFAPFFVPLALWVGAMITYMVLRPMNPRLVAGSAPAWRTALAGWLPGLALGALQVAVLLAVLRLGLGLSAEHWAGVAAFLVLTAAAFLAIVQAVNALLGPPGRVAVLALLMLQLTSAAGTYPIETSPGFFQAVSPWLPMSWVVAGMRRLISGGDLTVVWQGGGVLTAFVVLGLTVTVLAVRKGRTWTVQRLKPELAL